jgi:hypothetical protein
VLSVLPSRWKGANILSLSASGTPGPQSITRSSILPPRALAVTSGGAPAGEYRSALAVRFAMTRSMTGGSATTLGSPGGRSTRTLRPDGPDHSERGRYEHDRDEQRRPHEAARPKADPDQDRDSK